MIDLNVSLKVQSPRPETKNNCEQSQQLQKSEHTKYEKQRKAENESESSLFPLVLAKAFGVLSIQDKLNQPPSQPPPETTTEWVVKNLLRLKSAKSAPDECSVNQTLVKAMIAQDVISSGVLIVTQAVTIWKTWQVLCSAKMALNELPSKIEKVSQMVKQLCNKTNEVKTKIEKVQQILEKESEKLQPFELTLIITDLNLMVAECSDVLDEIEMIRLTVSNRVTCLRELRNDCIKKTTNGFAHLFGNVIEMVILNSVRQSLGNVFWATKAAITGVVAATVATNMRQQSLATQVIERLQVHLQVLVQQKTMVRAVRDNFRYLLVHIKEQIDNDGEQNTDCNFQQTTFKIDFDTTVFADLIRWVPENSDGTELQ